MREMLQSTGFKRTCFIKDRRIQKEGSQWTKSKMPQEKLKLTFYESNPLIVGKKMRST